MNGAAKGGLAAALLLAAAPAAAQQAPPACASACSGCHPPSTAAAPVVPPLNGRAPEDIVTAMLAFRSGQQPATVMDRIAKGFADDEVRAIAAWLSTQE